ncbi:MULTISPECIES: type II toxin-antitoxin system HipA family toxin [Pandoraea]|uniref:Phosphatidylinositol kinase n=2 Tax=Pandoraea TaxID=93217 RepID=A0A5E4XJ61_9BURK|nr:MULTISPECIES: type II toxin-antitoxin system HipA family toxin [Pandoraea]VVE18510.1 phosphatidylinositol kinase [Pandoraea cepalis]VVE36336.1 phosphatidylinositol kinase [Pandoraea terrigena]
MATIAPKTRRSAPRRAAYQHVDRVEVYLWDELVGAVALDPAYGYYAFAWSPDFIESGVEPAPLQMPTDRSGPFIFPNLPDLTYKRLPAMLADALPDDFGNALIDRYMAEQGISASGVTPLDRLAYMNSRAMGALIFKPSRGSRKHVPTSIKLSDLVEEARRAVHGAAIDDDGTNAALRSIIDVGTSAGGARAKAVIALNPDTKEILSGQMDVPDGYEHWLLKFDGMGPDNELGTSQGYGRIEYAYYQMATAAKITMSPCTLLEENGRAHFMTRRFDREAGNVRHHMQTLCAMAHLDYKKKGTNAYAQLFGTIRDLDLSYEDMEEAFRRMVFNVMARNCDDHTKNFSFRLRRGRAWELAPAYDVTFAHNPQGEWTHQHLMSVNGKFKDFTIDDFLAEAELFGIGSIRRVIAEVQEAVSRWPEFAAQAGVDEQSTEKIQSLLLPMA